MREGGREGRRASEDAMSIALAFVAVGSAGKKVFFGDKMHDWRY